MIKVNYNPKTFTLTVKGHSRLAEEGQDIVCSAATILVHTLAENVIALHNAGMLESKHTIVKRIKGNAKVRCIPLEEHKEAVRIVFNSIAIGFKLLADSYPKNIFYKIFECGCRNRI